MMKIERSVHNLGVDTCKTNENSSKTSNITASDEQKLFVCVFLRMWGGASKTIKRLLTVWKERSPASLEGCHSVGVL